MKEENSLFEYKGWHVVGKIGSGSFGTVYEIEREDFGYQYKAALKIISIPNSEQDLSQIQSNVGKSEGSLEVYYESVASEIVKEFELMYKLRGVSNIVSYEDHEVRKHKGGIGWDIMIRMELLTPLNVYLQTHSMKRKDIIHLGIDICKALERCERYHIIHRDIKPGNIFVSEQGDFKLGDFGIARTIEAHDAVLELSKKGTISYMAPEIFRGSTYDFSVDMYSLGIVMYRMLNHNTLPFMPLPPSQPTYTDFNSASQRRFSGEAIPEPSGDDTQLADVVLKACSYRPEDRYQSPKQMREHLEMVLRGELIEEFDDKTILIERKSENIQKKNRPKVWKIILLLALAAAIVGVIIGIVTLPDKQRTDEQNQSEDIGERVQSEEEGSELQKLIEEHDFVISYNIIRDAVKNGDNLDEEIQMFVRACEEELEYKRAAAAMKLLSDDVAANQTFYIETVQWFYGRKQEELALQILSDLREKGEEGAKLADTISLENNGMNVN